MDTSAGISLRPGASILCVLNGGDPRVAARTPGYRELLSEDAPPAADPTSPGGVFGFLSRLTGTRAPAGADDDRSPFPFARAETLLRALRCASPPDAPRKVTVAVPAWANDIQRQKVAQGARAAGWELLGLVNEPTAAALASGILRQGDGVALVYDLADDRFDVTVVSFQDIDIEILASDGLIGINGEQPNLEKLRKTEAPCRRALQYASISFAAIDSIVLVGESTRDATTVEFVADFFGLDPLTRFDPEEVVGFGAAAHASIIESRKR